MITFLQLFVLLQLPVHASLGDKADSIDSDQKRMKGQRLSSVSQTNYTVHHIQAGSLRLKEYVSVSDGKVFAITWKGTQHPDLSALLGGYYTEYTTTHQQNQTLSKIDRKVHGRRSSLQVQSGNIMVEKSGHMRGSRGKAVVMSLIPEGVSPDEIK